MEVKEFRGFKYYGKLYNEEALREWMDDFNYPIGSHVLRGEDGYELVEKLMSIEGVSIYIDIHMNRDGGDTLFIEMGESMSLLEFKKIVALVVNTAPSEFDFNDDYSVLRVWWD